VVQALRERLKKGAMLPVLAGAGKRLLIKPTGVRLLGRGASVARFYDFTRARLLPWVALDLCKGVTEVSFWCDISSCYRVDR
jgi:hypothetical protein